MSDYFPLSAVISELRAELSQAQSKGEGEGIRFTIDEIELNLQVVAGVKGAAKGSGKFWNVVNFEASGEASRNKTHSLRLKMKIAGKDAESNGTTLVSNEIELAD